MVAQPRTRRVDAEEVQRRWRALSKDRRAALSRFDDPSLISAIRTAVFELFQKQSLMKRVGLRPSGLGPPDLSADSNILKELIDLHWKLETSEEHPDSILMDPDDQVALMTLRPVALEGDFLFSHLKGALPDFLVGRRAVLPKAKWKTLFAKEAASVAALERMLAELFEQALWGMASDAATAVAEPQTPNARQDDVPLEEWMADVQTTSSTRNKNKKTMKKQRRPQGGQPTVEETSSTLPQVVDEYIPETDTCHDVGTQPSPCIDACTQLFPTSDILDSSASRRLSKELSLSSRGRSTSSATSRSRRSTADLSPPRIDLLHAGDATPATSTSFRPPMEGAAHSMKIADIPEQSSKQKLLSDEKRHCVEDSEEPRRQSCASNSPEPSPEPPCGAASEHGYTEEFKELPVVTNHYWGSQERFNKPGLPVLQWCLPSGLWGRGRWMRPQHGDQSARVGAVVRVQKTFIGVEDVVSSSRKAWSCRLSRSLSPRQLGRDCTED